jgi:hypothetical protein
MWRVIRKSYRCYIVVCDETRETAGPFDNIQDAHEEKIALNVEAGLL